MSETSETTWSWNCMDCVFRWDLAVDFARLTREESELLIWQGTLLPLFWLALRDGRRVCVKAALQEDGSALMSAGGTLRLRLGELGSGELEVEATPTGLQFTRLAVTWFEEVPALISLYLGAAPMTPEELAAAPTLELPFWPNWQAEGFCVPGAKGAPLQSFYRNWDLGHATLPLGNFGPALGVPYVAAFPRPLLCAALGGESGWAVFGPGTLPDGALTLEMRAARGCLHYLYREDLWGSLTERERVWEHPLRITWSSAQAWDTYLAHFQTFPPLAGGADNVQHQRSHWNTWGDFKTGHFDLRALGDWTAHEVQASLLCLDDLWETSPGSGIANRERFPHFDEDLRAIKEQGLETGFWMPTGWVDTPEVFGLETDDLLCGRDGVPRRVNWTMSPYDARHYCLDPSSSRALAFLRQRTQNIMRQYQPLLLKLDFSYGLPAPHVAVPRDPALRGERMGYKLLETIAQAAREINPAVTIEYYGIHPLMRSVTDLISLDDLGDAGWQEREGHQQWSVWVALAGAQGVAITASSGYNWEADSEILLDTAIIGAPGAVLARRLPDGSPVPPVFRARRQALARWHRRTVSWTPLWLNSHKGSPGKEPSLACWGRLEQLAGANCLTALVLRGDQQADLSQGALSDVTWTGPWALIAQDDQSLFRSRRLACISLGGTALSFPCDIPTSVNLVFSEHQEAFPYWQWTEGIIQLHIPERDEYQAMLGLLLLYES